MLAPQIFTHLTTNSLKCILSRTWGTGRPHVGLCPIFLVVVVVVKLNLHSKYCSTHETPLLTCNFRVSTFECVMVQLWKSLASCESHLRKFSCESYLRKWLSQETFWCVIGLSNCLIYGKTIVEIVEALFLVLCESKLVKSLWYYNSKWISIQKNNLYRLLLTFRLRLEPSSERSV